MPSTLIISLKMAMDTVQISQRGK